MPSPLRRLNADGIAQFESHLRDLKSGLVPAPITSLLTDTSTSTALDTDITVDSRTFSDRYDFGDFLVRLLAPLDRRQISRDHGLWTWLAAYFFEQICPPGTDPAKISAFEAYVLPAKYNFYDYYRHLVRTPWYAVSEHGKFAKILLVPRSSGRGDPPLTVRGEIIEQLASRQAVFRNRRVIEAAYLLYWDEITSKPRPGTGGRKDANGAPNRLGKVLRQFDLTFDLDVISPSELVALLPKEFSKWRSRER